MIFFFEAVFTIPIIPQVLQYSAKGAVINYWGGGGEGGREGQNYFKG